ncbi:histidine phosphatase family protein [Candidatus Pacearchaeota archaeon]|nr:histidine phosphatase family protein [Candidatus Pacearchaeota archaeon]
MKLYLVRHAKSERNAGHNSHEDKLTEDGKEQARRLGKYFHNVKLDKIYCSTLERAKETLGEIKPYVKNVPLIYSKKIVEQDIGIYRKYGKDDWENYFKDAVKSGKHIVDFKPKAGESMRETYNRAKKFYNLLIKNHKNSSILVVSHGIFLRYLILIILNLDILEARLFGLSNAAVSSFIIDKKGKVKQYHIDDFHHLLIHGVKNQNKIKNIL